MDTKQRRLSHISLFSFGHGRDEVYEALDRDYKRDTLNLRVIDLIGMIALLIACRNLDTITIIAITIAYWAAISGTRFFVDQSNRRWFLHRIDWDRSE